MTREDNIRSLVTELKTRQSVLTSKTASNVSIRLFEGREAKGKLPGYMPKGALTFEVIPPHRFAKFECEFIYFTAAGGGVKPQKITLKNGHTVDAVRIKQPAPPKFGTIGQALRNIQWDRRIEYRLRYQKSVHPRAGFVKEQETFRIIVR